MEDRGFFIGIIIRARKARPWTTRTATRDVSRPCSADVPEIAGYFMVVAPGLDRPNPVNLRSLSLASSPGRSAPASSRQIAAELVPKMSFPAWRPGISHQSALARPELSPNPRCSSSSRAVPIRAARVVDELMAKARELSRAREPGLGPEAEQAPAQDRHQPRQGRRCGVEVEAIGPHAGNDPRRPPGHALQARGKQYDVIVKLAEDERRVPADLASIYVRGGNGTLVQLANLVGVTETVAPKELNHFNRLRAAIIRATIAPGYTLGDALGFLERLRPRSCCRPRHDRSRRPVPGVSRVERGTLSSRSCSRSCSSISCSLRSSRASSIRS